MTESAASQRTPIDLVTGFLGSGKTTLINAVLRDPAFAGAMVIVNEFGEVGLDHLLMSTAQDNVVLLDSGCLCCAVSGTLRDTLIDLFSRRASGTVQPFNRIIVETSGLAHPGPLVASLMGDTALTPRCTLSQVLTLVDAGLGLETLERYPEAQRQVAFGDRLLISKTDTASAQQIDALEAALRALNPDAPIERRDPTASPALHFALLAMRTPWLPGPLQPATATHSGAYTHISTHVLSLPGTISWAAYAACTAALRARFGKRLLRCKGLLRIEPDNTLWVVQGVQGYFAPPQRLPAGDDDYLSGFLVCIGEDITRADLDAAINTLEETT